MGLNQPQSFHVNRDEDGEMFIDPDTWVPEPELVVAVSRNGAYAFVSKDDSFWTDSRIVSAMINLTDKMIDRIRVADGPTVSDVQPPTTGDTESR